MSRWRQKRIAEATRTGSSWPDSAGIQPRTRTFKVFPRHSEVQVWDPGAKGSAETADGTCNNRPNLLKSPPVHPVHPVHPVQYGQKFVTPAL